MKLKITLLLFAIVGTAPLRAQIVTVPDANFKAKLLQASTGIQIAKNLSGQWFKIDANSDNQIQVSEAQQVSALYVNFSSINNMSGIAGFTNLKLLSCYNNTITGLDVSALPLLQELYCYNNNLTSLLVTGTALKRLDCYENLLLPALNLTGLSTMEYLNCSRTRIANLNVSNFTQLTDLLFGGGIQSQWFLQTLNISGCTGLTTIPYFEESVLTNFDLSNCTALTSVSIGNAHALTTLNVSGCTALINLDIYRTALTSLNVSGLTSLTNLKCTDSNLTSLNVSGLTNLRTLDCTRNQLAALSLTSITNLTSVTCSYNQLLSLDLTGLSNLNWLYCDNNQLLSLDLSTCTDIGSVECGNNQLLSLFMKNGKHEHIGFSSNPILLYICTDDDEAADIQGQVDGLGYVNCQVNTYCSFVPGGISYTVQGTSRIDTDNNGCDASDMGYPNLKYNISSGTTTGSIIADATGNFSVPVVGGIHTIVPALENPSFFTVSPANVAVDFPTMASPFNQDFCITPNGTHNDLEVTIIQLATAVPGFDVAYKLIYKNKGNTTLGGQVSLGFQDDVIDFVSSDTAVASQSPNTLVWDYTNLAPFETRTISFVMNLNTPMETPPLNSDDFLYFTADISPLAADETAADNHATMFQIVFNSMDPNDKICLEGNKIDPSMAGKYLHYKIRFENTGNFAAQNIVVKDIIDTAMFDVGSLEMVSASHSCVTKISDTNKVEFIFENINLLTDDANNDGYVVFKIKTKPTVVLGDILKNQAGIYFDYNFPVVTNETSTVVQNLLGNTKFDLKDVRIYPNPVKDMLNIQSHAPIRKIEIFDTNGRLLQSSGITNNQKDLSNLSSGIYFVKLYSNGKIGMIKITKE